MHTFLPDQMNLRTIAFSWGKNLFGSKIGKLWKTYSNLDKPVIFTTAALPNQEKGFQVPSVKILSLKLCVY